MNRLRQILLSLGLAVHASFAAAPPPAPPVARILPVPPVGPDRKSTRLNSSHT
mgnify:CR=1 FL=1